MLVASTDKKKPSNLRSMWYDCVKIGKIKKSDEERRIETNHLKLTPLIAMVKGKPYNETTLYPTIFGTWKMHEITIESNWIEMFHPTIIMIEHQTRRSDSEEKVCSVDLNWTVLIVLLVSYLQMDWISKTFYNKNKKIKKMKNNFRKRRSQRK